MLIQSRSHALTTSYLHRLRSDLTILTGCKNIAYRYLLSLQIHSDRRPAMLIVTRMTAVLSRLTNPKMVWFTSKQAAETVFYYIVFTCRYWKIIRRHKRFFYFITHTVRICISNLKECIIIITLSVRYV